MFNIVFLLYKAQYLLYRILQLQVLYYFLHVNYDELINQ